MKKIILFGGMAVLLGLLFFYSQNDKDKAQRVEIQPTVVENSPEEVTITSAVEVQSSGNYVIYSKEAFDKAVDKKRVYFFHAQWCPTCKIANQEFTENDSRIPENVIVFKTDYDKEIELKKKFAITYQHTFVYVDLNNEVIKIWNGGGMEELISNLTDQ